MNIITHNNKFLSIRDGKIYGSEVNDGSLGFLKINNYILFYDKISMKNFNIYEDISVYGYFFEVKKVSEHKYSIFDPNFREFISFVNN